MVRPDRIDLLVVGAATLIAGVGVPALGGGVAEWVFGTACLVTSAILVRGWVEALRRTGAERRRRDRLRATVPQAAARAAVLAERARLADDIASELRRCLTATAEEVAAAQAADDPRPALRRIHRLAQQATSELRRQLGLLRTPDDLDPAAAGPGPAPVGAADVGLAALAVGLAAFDLTMHPLPAAVPALAAGLTVVAAAAVVVRRTAPRVGALVVTAAYLGGAAADSPVTGGLWFLVSVVPLLWVLLARSRPLGDLAVAAGCGCAVPAVSVVTDRDNAAAATAVVLAVTGVALAARWTGWAGERARGEAVAHEAALAAAVRAERLALARDLHDTVSQAVALVAVQAAAAEVSWPDRPAAVRDALDLVAAAVAEAGRRLDRAHPGPATAYRSLAELTDLAARIRRAGTPVALDAPDSAPVGPASDLAVRIVAEALTNTVRHAGGAAAAVRVRATAAGLTVRVTDDGAGAGHDAAGFGLVGLAERVALAGGELSAGPGRSGFAVAARIPYADQEALR